MAKFAVFSTDGWVGEILETYEEAVSLAATSAESQPDTEYFVTEIKAKVVAELKVEVVVDENEFEPSEAKEE